MKGIESTCPAKGTVQAVDLSIPVDQKFLDVAKCLGVKLIIRYGDNVVETVKGKTPLPAELVLIAKNGLDFLAVFQHNNSSISSFTAARGTADANRMQVLYPNAKVWYFGVDAEFGAASDQAAIKTYATAFAKVAKANGKQVGVYGDGLTLTNLKATGLVSYYWLSNATSWAGTSAFNTSKQWALKQGLPKKCGGKEGDFDVTNPQLPDTGSWKL